ncbi:MAG: hypothetical protein H0W78_00890 [Planctomycetes bacterium]|nr:hypothetical protein [Planctomycetota bacterium]
MQYSLVCLLLSGACQLAASEIRPVDLRVTAMLSPETERVDATYSSASGGGGYVSSDPLNSGYRIEVGLVTRVVELSPSTALVGGGWVFYGDQKSNASGDLDMMVGPRSYLVFGIDLYLAWRAQFNHYVGMEIGPVVGAGTTRFSDRRGTETASVEEVGHGNYREAGMNLQFLLRNHSRSALLTFGVRYLASYGEADNSFGDMVQVVEVEQRGFAPFISLGTTF